MAILEMDKAVADYSRKERADAVVTDIVGRTKRAMSKAAAIEVCLETERRLVTLVDNAKMFSAQRESLGGSSSEAEAIIVIAKGLAAIAEWQLALVRAQIDFALAD